ncbi:hypothetical protein EJB05_11932, partial [Eragrostis curvula]
MWQVQVVNYGGADPPLEDPQLPALTDDHLEEIFVRIACPADLARTSAACVAYHRLIADPAFLRRYRSRHPPLLFGFFSSAASEGFHPVEAPHPNAQAARALAKISFDYLPVDKLDDWYIRDVRDGRVLIQRRYNFDDDSILPYFATKFVVLIFDSGSGSWTVSASATWKALSLRRESVTSLYWQVDEMNKLLKLDIDRMEFSTVNLPLGHDQNHIYANEHQRGNEWELKNVIPLPVHGSWAFYAQQGYTFLRGDRKVQDLVYTCYSLDINTLKLERAIQLSSRYFRIYPYFGVSFGSKSVASYGWTRFDPRT